MCTVSWLFEEGGYSIWFNRDELKTRSSAFPPSVRNVDGITFIAPRDPDGNGTWIGVNIRGFSCCLLNHYPFRHHPNKDGPSRGLITEAMLGCESQQNALSKLRGLPLANWRPFYLLLFQTGDAPLLCTWNGTALTVAEPHLPLTSSSFLPEEVLEARRRSFPVHPDDPSLDLFHSSHVPERGPYSVCMHRPEAETVSFTKIHVRHDSIDMEYLPASPCRGGEIKPQQLRIDRSAVGSSRKS